MSAHQLPDHIREAMMFMVGASAFALSLGVLANWLERRWYEQDRRNSQLWFDITTEEDYPRDNGDDHAEP